MPTQRPFLSNFLAAFRAHQQLPKPNPSLSSSATAGQSLWTSAASTSSNKLTTSDAARGISAKSAAYHTQGTTSTGAGTAAAATTAAATTTSSTHLDRPFLQHNVTPQTHLPRSPPSPGLAPYSNPQAYPTAQEARRTRRGSDSSSDSGGGFREVRGAGAAAASEKWFVGGRTANGEEKYYALAKIRRDRSSDRISTDQLSL